MRLERQLQEYIMRSFKEADILVYKFTSPGRVGVPDLVCIPRNQPAFFVEVKSPSGKGRLSQLQRAVIRRIEGQGCEVLVIGSKQEADDVIEGFRND